MSSRAWCFTINSWTTDDAGFCAAMAKFGSRYTICGFEKGSKKQRDHIQGYVYFDSAKTLSRLKKYLPRAHLEVAKGTPQQNRDYCTKEGDYWESGICPTQGMVSREKLEDVMKNPYENFHLYNQYRRAYTELKRLEPKTHTRRLLMMASDDRYKMLQGLDVLFVQMNGDLMNYNDESVVVFDYNELKNLYIEDWINGFPKTIKRGYELIKFDPEVVYLMYNTPHEFEMIEKVYKKYLTID